MGGKTPAQLYSLVFGAVLLLAGILGFFFNASFAIGESVERDQLIVFEVNGWHNVVHLASGIVGLALAGTPASARLFALGFGAVYALVFLLGLFMDPLLGLLPINAADNVLHLLIALAGIGAGLASSTEPAPTTA
jgi:hypothetical protein